jgi:hypothetical protein
MNASVKTSKIEKRGMGLGGYWFHQVAPRRNRKNPISSIATVAKISSSLRKVSRGRSGGCMVMPVGEDKAGGGIIATGAWRWAVSLRLSGRGSPIVIMSDQGKGRIYGQGKKVGLYLETVWCRWPEILRFAQDDERDGLCR